ACPICPARLAKRMIFMLKLWNLASRADLLDRREHLRIGGLSLAGLSLPALLQAQPLNPTPLPRREARQRPARSFGQAKRCIILYLSGAPSQLDMFDPKPDAPDDIRGEFSTIATSVTGV